jgi:hypothetical protein
MPQDSVYIIKNSADTSSLPDTVKAVLNELPDSVKAILIAGQKDKPLNRDDNQGPGPAIGIYLSIILDVIIVPIFARYIRSQLIRKRREKDDGSKEVVFDNILLYYIPIIRT